MAHVIDLRSDTVTRPVPAMREAMARAEVGDDVYGEDPSINLLEERAAELLGKEAALFVPSGTMSNQIALLCHCARGEQVLAAEGSHIMLYESGAGSAFAGVGFSALGKAGRFDVAQLLAAIEPPDVHVAPARLLTFENATSEGEVFPQAQAVAVTAAARTIGLRVHLDGARIWNAAAAGACSAAKIASVADTVSACLSKGLGAPVGSVLAGSRELIARGRRFRKMLGGGMRQAGVLAAAGLYALAHHRERLVEDHDNARHLAQGLATLAGVSCDLRQVATNIVFFDVDDAAAFAARAAQAGVLVLALGPRRMRAVTHLDVSRANIDAALARLAKLQT